MTAPRKVCVEGPLERERRGLHGLTGLLCSRAAWLPLCFTLWGEERAPNRALARGPSVAPNAQIVKATGAGAGATREVLPPPVRAN